MVVVGAEVVEVVAVASTSEVLDNALESALDVDTRLVAAPVVETGTVLSVLSVPVVSVVSTESNSGMVVGARPELTSAAEPQAVVSIRMETANKLGFTGLHRQFATAAEPAAVRFDRDP